MILLDTNVLSELMEPEGDIQVIAWLDRQAAASVWTTAITVFETRYGISLLSEGKHRQQLENAFTRTLDEALERRILAFDAVAAEHTGRLAAKRRQLGRSAHIRDTMIAGIALAHRAAIATRNTRHFTDLDIPVINPWET